MSVQSVVPSGERAGKRGDDGFLIAAAEKTEGFDGADYPGSRASREDDGLCDGRHSSDKPANAFFRIEQGKVLRPKRRAPKTRNKNRRSKCRFGAHVIPQSRSLDQGVLVLTSRDNPLPVPGMATLCALNERRL